MSENTIIVPSKPRVVLEEDSTGIFEIDSLYPGYGHTLGNSLRRIILSSLTGAAITSIKVAGVNHEFTTIEGIKEDIITIILNLKRIRIKLSSDLPQTLSLKIKGPHIVTASDIKPNGLAEILNPEQKICEITSKTTEFDVELTVENGLGYVSKENMSKNKVDIGTIALDANFTPIRRVSYEVDKMRVGERTDFDRLRIIIETDGTLTPKQALENSILIMINQLKAVIGFQEPETESTKVSADVINDADDELGDIDSESLKTRIENLGLSSRTFNALSNANIRTVGGLAKKREIDILDIEGLGNKGLQEIIKALGEYGITLK